MSVLGQTVQAKQEPRSTPTRIPTHAQQLPKKVQRHDEQHQRRPRVPMTRSDDAAACPCRVNGHKAGHFPCRQRPPVRGRHAQQRLQHVAHQHRLNVHAQLDGQVPKQVDGQRRRDVGREQAASVRKRGAIHGVVWALQPLQQPLQQQRLRDDPQLRYEHQQSGAVKPAVVRPVQRPEQPAAAAAGSGRVGEVCREAVVQQPGVVAGGRRRQVMQQEALVLGGAGQQRGHPACTHTHNDNIKETRMTYRKSERETAVHVCAVWKRTKEWPTDARGGVLEAGQRCLGTPGTPGTLCTQQRVQFGHWDAGPHTHSAQHKAIP